MHSQTPPSPSAQPPSSTVATICTRKPPDETEERPSLSYKDLIIEAIESSTDKRLKLSEIYQVIRYLHPFYRNRQDQWGWQNSIRHNLSLHDCFVKLPIKQTSASGVVGHFWTVVRDGEEKSGSSRRRSRHSGRSSRCSNGNKFTAAKAKERQSVSSDSGVVSDESQANSPIVADNTKSQTQCTASPLAVPIVAPQLHRPVPSYVGELQNFSAAPTNAIAENLFAETPTLSSALLSRLALNTLPEVPSVQPSLLQNVDPIQRLQLLSLYLNSTPQYSMDILQQLLDAQTPPPPTATSILTQLLLSKIPLYKLQQPPTPLQQIAQILDSQPSVTTADSTQRSPTPASKDNLVAI